MTVTLTTKEKMLLKDQKESEELCVQKYANYANQAQDPELKQLFSSLSQKEQEHLNTVNQILSGQVPNMQQNAQAGQQAQQNQQPQQNPIQGAMASQGDKALCADMLSTEKYVSGAYDTTIFECVQPSVRQALNHIQKEEQEHGEQIFNYMQSHGMYNPE